MSTELKLDCKSVDAEFDRAFADRSHPLSPQLRQHLDECERCNTLYRILTRAPQPAAATPVSPVLQQKISHNLRQSLRPVSQLRSTPVLAAQLLAVALLITVGVTSMLKLVGVEAMSAGQMIGIIAILAVGVVLLTRSLAWQMTPGSLQRIPAWRAVAILSVGLLVGIVVLFPWHTPQAFLARGLHCLRVGLSLAIPAGGLFWILARRGAPLDLTALGATLGAIAGLIGVAMLQFSCNLQDIGHLVTWHCGVLLITTVMGALIGHTAGRTRLDPAN